jgi:hypothetical protein
LLHLSVFFCADFVIFFQAINLLFQTRGRLGFAPHRFLIYTINALYCFDFFLETILIGGNIGFMNIFCRSEARLAPQDVVLSYGNGLLPFLISEKPKRRQLSERVLRNAKRERRFASS